VRFLHRRHHLVTSLYVFFFIELERRRVHIAGGTAHPNGAWATQQARNILTTLNEDGKRPQILIRDRDVKLTKALDDWYSAWSQNDPVIYATDHAQKTVTLNLGT
jgi:putative transposase